MALVGKKERKEIRGKARKQTRRQIGKEVGRERRKIDRIGSNTAKSQARLGRQYSREIGKIADTDLSGMGNKYAAQVRREIEGVTSGLANVKRHHINRTGQAGAAAQREIRSGIRDLRESTYDSNFASLMDAARTHATDRQEIAAEKAAAVKEAQFLISRIPVTKIGDLHSQATRDALAEDVAGDNTGVSIQVARRIVEQMYQQMLPKLPPGVLSTRERRAQGRPLEGDTEFEGLTDEQLERYRGI